MNKYKLIWCLIIGSVSILSLVSCQQTNNPNNCEKVMCTALFGMITVELKDSIGNNYMPDKVETYLNGAMIHQDSIPAVPMQNVYTIVDDNNLQTLQLNVNRDVVFKIIKNGLVVKEETYTVKADCCHVSKVSGSDVIQL